MSHRSSSTPSLSFWHEVRATFRGETRDFTTGSLSRAIALLAIPMVLEMLMQSVFGVVDIFFVAHLGPTAVAAVGLTDSLLILVLAVGMGLGMAATAMVARRIGEKDYAGASAAALHVLVAGVLISLPISALGLFAAPDLLRLMGAEPEVIAAGSGYVMILFGTNATILLLFLINALFRGAGEAVLAMQALWIANLINIALDPVLIFGWGPIPALGVPGAAVATTIGRGLGVLFQIWLIARHRSRIRLSWNPAHLQRALMLRIARVSLPGTLQYIIGTASWLALYRIVAVFGSEAVAGYTIAIRILVFFLLPSWGMGNAAATLVGQNLGAGHPNRAERSVWLTSRSNMIFLGLVTLMMLVYADPLVRLFTDAPAVAAYGIRCLHIVSYTYVFFAFGMVTVQAFNGAGDTTTPTLINFVSHWLLQIPLAYGLAQTLEIGLEGVFWAIAVAQAFLAVLSVLLFRRGTWKHTLV